MKKSDATGWFGRPSLDGQRAVSTKVHYVRPDGKTACGYAPHRTMAFQWCAPGVHQGYLECSGCRRAIARRVKT